MTRRSLLFYAAILCVWGLVFAWQVLEHRRVQDAARNLLIRRGRDITSTLGLVLRSQRRFGTIQKERLESALSELVKSGEPNSIVLFNAAGEVVASAGEPVDVQAQGNVRTGVHWDEKHLTLANLVDLGTNFVSSTGEPSPTLVIPRADFLGPRDTNRTSGASQPRQASTNDAANPRPPPPGGSNRRPSFGRPSWMTEEEYKTLIQKQGAHSFLIVMSTSKYLATAQEDLLLRYLIGVLATIAAFGSALAWRNLDKSSELQIRLVRASEQNAHLKELNLAAAGLAHETRNPLNIIRGLAQIISREPVVADEIRQKSRQIVEEADRVTAQLSEFINYSRPRELRRSSVLLGAVVNDVARALAHDVEEKQIKLKVFEESVAIEADEQLLRQAVFNLLINAVQALASGDEISVAANRRNGSLSLEVRDTGPGVPPDQRQEVFKPYFTTHQKGAGLGLAVVQQIVSLHDWDIECDGNQPKGAVFRINRMKVVSKPG